MCFHKTYKMSKGEEVTLQKTATNLLIEAPGLTQWDWSCYHAV